MIMGEFRIMVTTQTEMMTSLNWGKLHETHLFMEMKLVEKMVHICVSDSC